MAPKNFGRSITISLLLLVTAALALVALMVPLKARLLSPSLEVGQVVDQDILAPREITYSSQALTQQRQEAAMHAVQPVYTTPDTGVARQQLGRLRTALAYITSVRADPYSSIEQKMIDLAGLEEIHLDREVAQSLLELSDARWQAVQQEAIVVLEQKMRSTIRSDRLEDAQDSIPYLISLTLSEDQASIVAHLAAAYIAPNSLYSESLTEAARLQARAAVEPVVRTFKTGETIVQRGQVLTEAGLEALQQIGLAQPQEKWQDITSAVALVLLLSAFMAFYFFRTPALTQNVRSLVLIAILFLAFLFAARLTVPGHTVLPYAYPLAAYGLLVSALFGAELALVSSLPLAILVAYNLPNALELSFYFILSCLLGVLMLGRARRVASFFWAGVVSAFAGLMVVLVYRLPLPTTDLLGLATLAGAAFFNGLAAASLALLLQFFLAQLLGMLTPMQLMELTRPDHSLLQLLLREAPGTYQHSLQVANLSEQAAERIGADTLLTRVGALYHDIGKAENPIFFIENQILGYLNPHDDLEPVISSETIVRHVPDGIKLAREHRLPRRLLDFITEHHGTMITRYQYAQAVASTGGDEQRVDIQQYRYPGPRPQSRETAILMLADGCEARVRAERPKDEDELRHVIKSVIDDRIAIGQLDDTTLTLRDLDLIYSSFTSTLRGIYHPRIQYPRLESGASTEAADSKEATIPLGLNQTVRRSTNLPAGPFVDRPPAGS